MPTNEELALAATPGPFSAGLYPKDLADAVATILLERKALVTNTAARSPNTTPAALQNAFGVIASMILKEYNLKPIIPYLRPDIVIEVEEFINTFREQQLTSKVSSVDTDLQRIYVLANPFGNTIQQILQETIHNSAGLHPAVESLSSLRNVRSIMRGRRREVSVQVRTTMGLEDAGRREGKGQAQQIHPLTGHYLYETEYGQRLDNAGLRLYESPLYIFHARAWARIIYAIELMKYGLEVCPWTKKPVQLLRQGEWFDPVKPPSRDNGGWWYLCEAEDHLAGMRHRSTNAPLVGGVGREGTAKLVLPYFRSMVPLSNNATRQERADAMTKVLLLKVGLDGDFGEKRQYQSDPTKSLPECTNISTLERIISDEKQLMGLDPEQSMHAHMNVLNYIPQYEDVDSVPAALWPERTKEELEKELHDVAASLNTSTTPPTNDGAKVGNADSATNGDVTYTTKEERVRAIREQARIAAEKAAQAQAEAERLQAEEETE